MLQVVLVRRRKIGVRNKDGLYVRIGSGLGLHDWSMVRDKSRYVPKYMRGLLMYLYKSNIRIF